MKLCTNWDVGSCWEQLEDGMCMCCGGAHPKLQLPARSPHRSPPSCWKPLWKPHRRGEKFFSWSWRPQFGIPVHVQKVCHQWRRLHEAADAVLVTLDSFPTLVRFVARPETLPRSSESSLRHMLAGWLERYPWSSYKSEMASTKINRQRKLASAATARWCMASRSKLHNNFPESGLPSKEAARE